MSSIVEDYKVDRRGWRAGPWDSEPDKLQWVDETTGLDCLIVRNHCGALCGYVGIQEGHPWYGKGYEDVTVEAHGGLTYAEKCAGHICHVPEPGRPDNVWWLGFDCIHAGDFAPGLHRNVARRSLGDLGGFDGEYRDVVYVRGECESLAKQAAEARA